jgi:hypothetical protein
LERWRWKSCEFDAEQIHSGGELPPGLVRADGVYDRSVVAYVSIDHMPIAVRSGDWLVFENQQVRRVVSNERFQKLAARVWECGS